MQCHVPAPLQHSACTGESAAANSGTLSAGEVPVSKPPGASFVPPAPPSWVAISTADLCTALHWTSLPFLDRPSTRTFPTTCPAAERWRASWPVPRHSHLQDTGRPLTSRLHDPKPHQSGALSPSAGLSKPWPTSRRALADVLNAARQQRPTQQPAAADVSSSGATAAGQARQQPPGWDVRRDVAAAPVAAAAPGGASPAWHRSLHITVPDGPGLQALGAGDEPEGCSADLTPVDPQGGVFLHGASQSPASAASGARAALVYNPVFGSSLTHSLGAEQQAGVPHRGEHATAHHCIRLRSGWALCMPPALCSSPGHACHGMNNSCPMKASALQSSCCA